jgi:hypothetical protein
MEDLLMGPMNYADVAAPADSSPIAVSAEAYAGYLGYGYNVLDRRFYNSDDISSNTPVLDARGLAKAGLIRRRRVPSSEARQIAGSTKREYQQDLGTSVGAKGSSGLFKGSFEASFNTGQSVSTSESFVKTVITIGLIKEYVDFSDASVEDLGKYATPTFRRDIDNSQVSPDSLFNMYGTHVLLNIKLGGRMELNYKVKNVNRMSQQDLKASANAAYGSVSGSASVSLSKDAKQLYENSHFTAFLYGGDSTANITSIENAQTAYTSWSGSLTSNNPVLEFVDTGDAAGLSNPRCMLPIWLLATNPHRRQEIETAYRLRLADATYIADVYFGYGEDSSSAKIDLLAKIREASPNAQFVTVDHDLNSGAKGNYIYMGYTSTKDAFQAITNVLIRIQRGSGDSIPTRTGPQGIAYRQSGQDLTKGCGGKTYIFFYYTKERAAGSPLTELNLEVNNKLLFNGNDEGWVPVHEFSGGSKADLNDAAGGDYIYLWQRRY